MPVKDTVVGSGKLYFNKFLPDQFSGIGEELIGGTLSFVISHKTEVYTPTYSQKGKKFNREDMVLGESISVSFETDRVSSEIVSTWFGASSTQHSQTSGAAVTESFTVYPGKFYQMGVSTQNPLGIKYVTEISATKSGSPINIADNFTVDAVRGRFFVKQDAPNVLEGDVIVFTYSKENVGKTKITNSGQTVSGSLRFVADNIRGSNRDYYFPFVVISSDGNLDLKKKDWQTVAFVGEARKVNGNDDFFYAEEVDETDISAEEVYIIETLGLSWTTFSALEDQLDTVINADMPNDFGE